MAVLYRRTISSPYYNGGTETYLFDPPKEGTADFTITDQLAAQNRAAAGIVNYSYGLTPRNAFVSPITGANADAQRAYTQAARNYAYFGDPSGLKVWTPTAPYMRPSYMEQSGLESPAAYNYSYDKYGYRVATRAVPYTGATTSDYLKAQNIRNINTARAIAAAPKSRFSASWESDEPNSPFLNTRYNMLGQREVISRSDPRHTASMYADRSPELYSQYTSGQISGNQLFTSAMRDWVLNDKDEIGNTNFNFSAPPTIKINFSGSGGGSISGTGISFPGLSGKRFW